MGARAPPAAARPIEAFALSPAFGIGALIAVGTVLDVAGVRLGGLGGHVAIPVAALAGWAVAAVRFTRSRNANGELDGEVAL